MKPSLSGKKCLITGASRGIGRALAYRLGEAGCHLCLTATGLPGLEKVREELGSACEVELIAADLGDAGECGGLISAAAQKLGGLDILINNAGIGIFGAAEHTSIEDYEKVMAVNARAPFILSRDAIPHLRRSERGFIINIGSVVSLKGYEHQLAYSASKHALLGMTKVLGRELQKDGIRVHAICPGGVDTDMIGDARPDLDRSGMIQADEIADAAVYLLTARGQAVCDLIQLRRQGSTPWP